MNNLIEMGQDHYAFAVSPAIVVGACGHGLAMIRALDAECIPVLALEANRSLPGTRTRLAPVVFTADINGNGLIEALIALRGAIRCPGRPVLMLTNDTMVRTVSENWLRLSAHYSLSWSARRDALLVLQQKADLEARCEQVGLRYPKSVIVRSRSDVDVVMAGLRFPIIVKPVQPLSKFKTLQPASHAELAALLERYGDDLPFLVQEFIPGDDSTICFSALYLDEGRVLARFDGRKLRSRPLGHTTIAEPLVDDEVFERTLQFFEGLNLSGPVSLELKRDEQGQSWVIEPTVGRTDFWVGLCTANGVNLPAVEYWHQTGMPISPQRQRRASLWFNEDRDPLGPLWILGQKHANRPGGMARSFTYLHAKDLGPSTAFVRMVVGRLMKSLVGRIRRLLRAP